MSIKEILEHPWITKFTSNKLKERRCSKDYRGSTFKLYTTVFEEENTSNQQKKII